MDDRLAGRAAKGESPFIRTTLNLNRTIVFGLGFCFGSNVGNG